MAETTTTHRPGIVRGIDEFGRRTYRFRCSCGAAGRDWGIRRLAQGDQAEHVATLPPVPADQRCEMPKAHKTPDWERCPLCSDQLSLLDLT